LQAESILIGAQSRANRRGIEVPNTRRELIGLRQMFESEEFAQSHSAMTIPLARTSTAAPDGGARKHAHLLIAVPPAPQRA